MQGVSEFIYRNQWINCSHQIIHSHFGTGEVRAEFKYFGYPGLKHLFVFFFVASLVFKIALETH